MLIFASAQVKAVHGDFRESETGCPVDLDGSLGAGLPLIV
jgi:hypothetical protein